MRHNQQNWEEKCRISLKCQRKPDHTKTDEAGSEEGRGGRRQSGERSPPSGGLENWRRDGMSMSDSFSMCLRAV